VTWCRHYLYMCGLLSSLCLRLLIAAGSHAVLYCAICAIMCHVCHMCLHCRYGAWSRTTVPVPAKAARLTPKT
jgi:hypothetical protein